MWFTKTAEDALKSFEVSPNGLTASEIQARRLKYGENVLKGHKKKSMVLRFLMQFKDMLIYVLLGAAAITLFIGEYADTVIILLVVILNATIGIIQENKAEKAIEALQQMAAPKALIRCDGVVKEVEASALVPGDIVILEAGRYVPLQICGL